MSLYGGDGEHSGWSLSRNASGNSNPQTVGSFVKVGMYRVLLNATVVTSMLEGFASSRPNFRPV